MKQPSKPAGFTLVELLVAVTLLSLLVGSLVSLFVSVRSTLAQARARDRMVETLTLLVHQMGADLRNVARNGSTHPTDPFRLVGRNGEATPRYVNDLTTAHPELSTNPARHSDRLHFHALNRDSRIDFGSDPGASASERVYYAYWVNGPASRRPLPSLGDRWGLLKRTVQHRRSDRAVGSMLPLLDGRATPQLDLNGSTTDFTGARVVGLYVDYFSVRYFDPENDRWVHGWDTDRRGGDLPSAIQYALRAYDPRTHRSPGPDNPVRPLWYQTAVDLRPR